MTNLANLQITILIYKKVLKVCYFLIHTRKESFSKLNEPFASILGVSSFFSCHFNNTHLTKPQLSHNNRINVTKMYHIFDAYVENVL